MTMAYIHCRHESRQKSQIKSLNVECGVIGFTEQEKEKKRKKEKKEKKKEEQKFFQVTNTSQLF